MSFIPKIGRALSQPLSLGAQRTFFSLNYSQRELKKLDLVLGRIAYDSLNITFDQGTEIGPVTILIHGKAAQKRARELKAALHFADRAPDGEFLTLNAAMERLRDADGSVNPGRTYTALAAAWHTGLCKFPPTRSIGNPLEANVVISTPIIR